jgi:rod shape-determining protein MreD
MQKAEPPSAFSAYCLLATAYCLFLMRWLPFLILAYLALGLQLGLSGYVELHGARANLVLLVAIYVAAHAPRDEGLLACFLLGGVQDLLSEGPWGLYALSYTLVALFVLSTHELVYGDHLLTHFTRALLGSWITAAVLIVHGWIYPLFHHKLPNWVHPAGVPLLLGSLYTAVLAIPVMLLLQRTRKAFGFRAPRGIGR